MIEQLIHIGKGRCSDQVTSNPISFTLENAARCAANIKRTWCYVSEYLEEDVMKKIVRTICTLFIFLFSVHTLGGVTLGTLGDPGPGVTTPNSASQPNSMAHGRSLDSWVEAYLRSWFEGAAVPKNNVTFLPIDPSDNVFEVEVKSGTALVLPIALWIGFPGDPELGVSKFFGAVTLDGLPIAEPNEDYYIGPTYLDPPITLGEDTVAFYEGLAVVINPLTPGEHMIQLYATITIPLPDGTNFVAAFSNTWNITVIPPGKAR